MKNGNRKASRTSDPDKKGENSAGSFIIIAEARFRNNPTTEKTTFGLLCPLEILTGKSILRMNLFLDFASFALPAGRRFF